MVQYLWWSSRLIYDESQSRISDISADGCPKVAVVVSITGIVGSSLAKILPRSDTPGGPWKVYGVAQRPQPKWFADTPIEYFQCDVLDEADTQAKITLLRDVTHVFWVVWVSWSTEERNCEDNDKIFQNVLDVLLPNAPNLKHIVLQTGGKHYIGDFSVMGKISAVLVPNFYYTLEDILFETVKKKEGLTWSVYRPNSIIGFSPSSLMDILGSLAAYAAICKHEHLPLAYPGNRVTWEQYGDVSDAELIGEQEIWACYDPNGKHGHAKRHFVAIDWQDGGGAAGADATEDNKAEVSLAFSTLMCHWLGAAVMAAIVEPVQRFGRKKTAEARRALVWVKSNTGAAHSSPPKLNGVPLLSPYLVPYEKL